MRHVTDDQSKREHATKGGCVMKAERVLTWVLLVMQLLVFAAMVHSANSYRTWSRDLREADARTAKMEGYASALADLCGARQ